MEFEFLQLVFAVGLILIIVAIVNKLVFKPVKIVFKLGYSVALGVIMIWAFNYLGGFFGLYMPANVVTILTAGFLGLPGLGLLMLLQLVV